jgi:hypothetical protein
VENWGEAQRKKKGAKKKEAEALWKLTPLMEIRSERGFPQRLGKHKTLSTVPTRPDGGSITFREAAVYLKHAFFWAEGWVAPQTLNGKCANPNCLNRGVHPIGLCPILCPPYIENHHTR